MSISRVVACNGVIDPVNALTVIVNIDPFLSLGAPFVASFADLCIPDFFLLLCYLKGLFCISSLYLTFSGIGD